MGKVQLGGRAWGRWAACGSALSYQPPARMACHGSPKPGRDLEPRQTFGTCIISSAVYPV